MTTAPPVDDDQVEQLEPDREVIDNYDLPPIFAKEGTDNAPTLKPIVFVYVYKKQGTQMGFIDFHPIEEMADVDQLRDAYGGGMYMLQGRAGDRKQVVKAVAVTIGGRAEMMHQTAPASRAELDFTKLAGAAIAVVTPLLTLWEGMSEKREARDRERREDERRQRAEERERDDARQNTFMETMTKLMGARMNDLEALLKAQQAAGGVGSAGGQKIHDAYTSGQADTLELIRMVKDEGLGGEDLESKVLGLVESFMVGKKKADEEIAEHANGKGA